MQKLQKEVDRLEGNLSLHLYYKKKNKDIILHRIVIKRILHKIILMYFSKTQKVSSLILITFIDASFQVFKVLQIITETTYSCLVKL